MTLPTDDEIEAAARWMCEQAGIKASRIEDDGRPAWSDFADDLRRHALMNEALRVANLAMGDNRPSGISSLYAESGEVAPLTEKELREVLERPRKGHRFVSGPEWRPIGEAKRWEDDAVADDIEICFPRERIRMFGFVCLSLSNGRYVIMTDSADYDGTDLDYAVEQGWRWKEPTPLPEGG